MWVDAGMVATEIRIELEGNGLDRTAAHIRYTYTGLSVEGNREVERFDENWFRDKMRGWEAAINHYLSTGKLIGAAGWE